MDVICEAQCDDLDVWEAYPRTKPKDPKGEEEEEEGDRQVITVNYNCAEEFAVPKGIDVEDTSQVAKWRIHRRTLYITMVNGQELEIQSKTPDELYLEKEIKINP